MNHLFTFGASLKVKKSAICTDLFSSKMSPLMEVPTLNAHMKGLFQIAQMTAFYIQIKYLMLCSSRETIADFFLLAKASVI